MPHTCQQKSLKAKPDLTVGLFRYGADLTGEPWSRITRSQAAKLRKSGDVRSVNRGKDLQLTTATPRTWADESARMGPAEIEKHAAGSKRHHDLINTWQRDWAA